MRTNQQSDSRPNNNAATNEQAGIKAGGATTFSNTIDNTENSLEDGSKPGGNPNQDTILNVEHPTDANQAQGKNEIGDNFDQLQANSAGNQGGSEPQKMNQIQDTNH